MIMTAAEFHGRKAIGKTQHKNPIAQDIYTLLQAYEGNISPNRKLKLLVLLYFLCLEYEWGKFGARGYQRSRFKKENLVIKLKGQIEAEVSSPAFQQPFHNKLAGEGYKAGVKVSSASATGTTLSGAYTVEAVLPQRNVVNKYNLQTRIPAFGMSLLTQEIENDFQINHGMQMHQSEQAAQQKIAGMSMIDLFKQIHAMWQNVNLQQMHFSFFDSAQRTPYLATFANNVWNCNAKTPFSTGPYPMMYVMDLNHRIFIPDGIATGGGQFNHSSMLSGKPVLCAGTITISTAGKLTYFDNDSGHYKPNTNALKEMATVLMDEYRIPVFGVNVKDKVTNTTTPLMKFR